MEEEKDLIPEEELDKNTEILEEEKEEIEELQEEESDIIDNLNISKKLQKNISIEDIKNIKKIADNPEVYTDAAKNAGKSVGKATKAIFSIPGLIVIVIILLVWIIYSSTYILGPITVGDECNKSDLIELKNLETEEKLFKSSYEYFRNQNLSPVIALALTQAISSGELKLDFSKDVTNLYCDNNCFIFTVHKIIDSDAGNEKNSPVLEQSKIDFFNQLVLLNAIDTIEKYGIDWRDPRTFYKAIAKTISETYSESEQTKQNLFEHSLSFVGIKPDSVSLEDLSRESKNLDKDLRCVVMGTGNGKGRIDGGGAIDKGLAALDMSNLIAFLESYCTEEKISITETDVELFGGLKATPEMIEAKALAVEFGGPDPMDGGPLAPNGVYASCDRGVVIAIKALEIDPDIPWGGVVNIKDYFIANPDKWQKLDDNCDRESGDIVIHNKPNNDDEDSHGHITVYGITEDGEEKIYEASFQSFLPWKHRAGSCDAEVDYIGRTLEYWRFVGEGE